METIGSIYFADVSLFFYIIYPARNRYKALPNLARVNHWALGVFSN
jgi:hypothetical protein